MNTRTSYVAIAIIAAVLATSTSAVFAQGYYDEEACPDCPDPASEMKREQAAQLDIPIRVWTDKAVYDHKSTITVEGSVANIRLGTEIGLTVIGPSPFNNIVAVDQLKICSDGKYKTTLSTAGDSWKYDGTYTIKVTYGSQQINNKALVQLTGESVTDTTRTVTIMFPNGAEEIEIIGTFAIPEFGAIAALILAVAIISIIAVSS